MIAKALTALMLVGSYPFPRDTCDEYWIWHDYLEFGLGMRIADVWGGNDDEEVQIWVSDGTGEWIMLVVLSKSASACKYYGGKNYRE